MKITLKGDLAEWIADYTWTLAVTQDQTAVTPEPGSMLLLGTGLRGFGARRWRNRGQAK